MRPMSERAAHTEGSAPRPPARGNHLVRSDWLVIGLSVAFTVVAGLLHYLGGGAVLAFVAAAAAVAVLAALVGRSVEQLGDRFGPGATGVLQSALGNLPELFISLFALQAGLVAVVQAALIGSILANLLLVLGLCFVVGGLKHGTQTLDSARARGITVMLLVSVAAMVMPSVAQLIHAPAAEHETTLSVIASVFLLLLFVLTLPASLRRGDDPGRPGDPDEAEPPRWNLPLAVGMLAVSAVAAAFVSDWFVDALQPAMDSIGISEGVRRPGRRRHRRQRHRERRRRPAGRQEPLGVRVRGRHQLATADRARPRAPPGHPVNGVRLRLADPGLLAVARRFGRRRGPAERLHHL